MKDIVFGNVKVVLLSPQNEENIGRKDFMDFLAGVKVFLGLGPSGVSLTAAPVKTD